MKFNAKSYSVEVAGDRISIFLGDRRYAVLRAGSSINGLEVKDIDEQLSEPEISQSEDTTKVVWTAKSSIWEEKTYELHLEQDLFWYQVKVKGQQSIDDLRYFDGTEPTHGYRKWSHFDFSQFFTPECSLLDQRFFKSMQYGCIDAAMGQMSEKTTDPYGTSHWIFTPPPFCYGLGYSNGPWLGAGVAPERGQYNFNKFEYFVAPNSFCFRLNYDGMTKVDGQWSSPKFIFCPAKEKYAALQKYCDTIRQWKLVDENTQPRADWWTDPMFCGWGEQNVQMDLREMRAERPTQEWSTQELYDEMLQKIEEKQLDGIKTITIDDKWQKHYGTCEVDTDKWPDLRAWVDARHAEGKKVILWFGACNCEGLPDEETIRDKDEKPISVDPTSPGYQARIIEIMHRLLSDDPGCYNADGIKYDWTNWFPIGHDHQLHGDIWGIELLKSLTKQLYEAAKAAKPDSMFITHTANPYFSECTDVIRLNDLHWADREICSMMTHRAKIGRMACPQALIDCDNSSAPTLIEWLEYMKLQPKLGIPSLYFLTAVDGTLEYITDKEWDEIADIWRKQD